MVDRPGFSFKRLQSGRSFCKYNKDEAKGFFKVKYPPNWKKKKKCSSLSVLCPHFASGAEKTSLSLSRKIDYTATTSASWFKLRIYRSIKLDNSFPVCESATIYARFCWVTLYIHHLWYMNYNKHWSEGRYSWMCWVVLIVAHIRPSYHRDMYVAKDKKSSVTIKYDPESGVGRIGSEAWKRHWWKEHIYAWQSETKNIKILTVITYRLQILSAINFMFHCIFYL